jgi:hypothetical protein
MISREISSMLQTELKPSKDFGIPMTQKDGVFGVLNISLLREKERKDL